MNDAVMTERPRKSKASPGKSGFEYPEFKIPNLEMPAAVRELAEKSSAQARLNCEKMRAATQDLTEMFEATFATAARGATEYGLKVFEVTRSNAAAAFDFAGRFMSAMSPSEAVELATAHARQQFDAASRQNKEFVTLAQRIATDAAEPIKAGMSKAFGRSA